MNMKAKNGRQVLSSGNPSESTAPASSASAPKKVQGFACMDPERQRQIARLGGLTAHRRGRAHHFTKEEASAAGQKGGLRVSEDREHMVTIGRQGGLLRWRNKRLPGAPAMARE